MKNIELSVEKILATFAFIFITIALYIIAVTPPATGYEISIYDAYPSYFWFFLIAATTCGVVILLIQAFTEKKSKWWLAGLAIIVFANTIFLLLPEFRGYALYGRWDTLTHMGYMKDILNTGHVGGSNFYPIIHILGTTLIQVAGLSIENIPSLFFVLFSGIYLVNMYLLARSASNHSGQVLLIVAFASPLIYSFFHANISPNALSLFMLPCLLYFYQKREQSPYGQHKNTALLFLMAFFITFFHPVTTIFVIAVFLTFGVAHTLYSRFLTHKTSEPDQYRSSGKNFLAVSMIMFITFFTWYFSYSSIQRSFKRVYDWLVYQIGTPLIEAWTSPLVEAELTPIQTFEIFVNRYGAIFLLLLVSGIACISVLRKSLSVKHDLSPNKFIYAVQFLMALFIGAAMLFGYFAEYNPVRVARLPLVMGTILSGLAVYDFSASKKKATKRAQRSGFMIAMVIIVMVALSFGSVYGSPRVWDVNNQTTRMDIAGTEWFGRLKDLDITVVANIPNQIRRFEHYNFGVDSYSVTRAMVYPERLPSHFGYDEHDQISETLGFQDRYLVIFGLDKAAQMLFAKCPSPTVHVYTEEDFAKLNSDPWVAKLYCNGEFEVWRVYGEMVNRTSVGTTE